MSDLVILTKARLSLLVIITTFVGFCAASGPQLNWPLLFHAVFGTTLAACAAAVLNQYVESNVDRLMERTRYRPLPAGRMKPATAMALGVGLGATGVTWLWCNTNALSAYLAAATIFVYIALYTPLKRRTSLCTIVGAISGAIPPVIGWTAVRPSLDPGAWVLFGILFTWQIPHFLAIAWVYRDEYAQAGFIMLKSDDVSGCATAMESLLFTAALAAITILPFRMGTNNGIYLGGALVLDAVMLFCAWQFLHQRTRPSARRLFFASIFFLLILLGLMVFTKA
ncbi:MAG: heme o synthase [Chthoniobacter sp.]|nr:heme o synthase [Chthoniobacter sp.]